MEVDKLVLLAVAVLIAAMLSVGSVHAQSAVTVPMLCTSWTPQTAPKAPSKGTLYQFQPCPPVPTIPTTPTPEQSPVADSPVPDDGDVGNPMPGDGNDDVAGMTGMLAFAMTTVARFLSVMGILSSANPPVQN